MRLTNNDQIKRLLARLLQLYGTYEHYPVGFLKNGMRGLFEMEVDVDQWPDPTSFVLKIKQDQNVPSYLKRRLHAYTLDPGQLEMLIRQPGVLDWAAPWDLEACTESVSKIVSRVGEEKGGQYSVNDECSFVYDIVPQYSREFPKGYSHAPMTLDQAKMVNEHWKYNKGNSTEKFIEYCIEMFPSICIYDKQGCPVAWGITRNYMGSALAYVVSEERGKNLAGHLAWILAQQNKQMGDSTFVYVDEGNYSSIRHADKSGFIRLPGRVFWGHYYPTQSSKL